MDIEVVDSVDVDDLLDLYESLGWRAYTANPDALERAVSGSTYVVTARHEGHLVGLARGLSDDSSVFLLQDILVRAEWQRRGIGRTLLDKCLDRFGHVRTKLLMTDDEERQHSFYRSMGYSDLADVPGLHAFVQIEGLT